MKIRKFLQLVVVTGAFGALLATPARAILLGDTITGTGIVLTPGSATIGAGVEFSFTSSGQTVNFDFGATTLTINVPGNVTAGGGSVTFVGFGNYVFSAFDDPITGFSIASNTGVTGSILNSTFTASSLTLDFSNVTFSGNNSIVFNIQQGAPGGSAPDSGTTAALLGVAFAGLVGLRRRLA